MVIEKAESRTKGQEHLDGVFLIFEILPKTVQSLIQL